MRIRARRTAAISLLLAAAAVLWGCGSVTFTAEELVAEVNRNGGGLRLGEPLTAAGDKKADIYALSFTGGRRAARNGDHTHTAGTLVIVSDEDTALSEYRRCEAAATLVCFRAANALLIFEGAIPEDHLTRLGHAIRALASD